MNISGLRYTDNRTQDEYYANPVENGKSFLKSRVIGEGLRHGVLRMFPQ
jgi:hypothetical protein